MNVRELMATIGLEFDDSGFKKADKAIKSLMGTFGAVVGVLAAAKASLEALTFEVAKHGEHLGAMADKLGLTTDDLQDLANAGKMAGVGLDEMGGALEGIQEKLIAASRVDKEAMLSFMRAGVSTHDAAGKMKPATDILRDLADQVQKQPTAARKMFVAQQLLGKSSEEMTRLLSGGSKGIAAFSEEARAAGAVMSKEFIAASKQMGVNLRALGIYLDGFKVTIATKVLPFMLKTIEAFRGWYKINGEIVRSIAKYGSQTIMHGFGAIIDIVMGIVNQLRSFYNWLEKIYPGLGKTVAIFAGLTIAFKALSALFAASPIGRAIVIVTALAAAFALVADDLKVFMEGGNSLFGKVVDWIGKFLGIKDASDKVRQALKDLWSGKMLEDALTWLTSMENAFWAWADRMWEAIKSPFKKLGDLLGLGGESASPTKIGETTEFLPGGGTRTIAAGIAGGGAESPAAAAALGPGGGVTNVGGASSNTSNQAAYNQTNHVSITINGGDEEKLRRVLDEHFGEEKQAAWAANTPGVALPTGAQ